MKSIILFFSVLFLLAIQACNIVLAQSSSPALEYVYDAAGNRVIRRIIVINKSPEVPVDSNQVLKNDTSMTTANSLLNDQGSTNGNSDGQQASVTQYSDNLNGHMINVYPNPTKGWLNVQIMEYSPSASSVIYIFDLSNKLLMQKECTSEYTKIDLSAFPANQYLMNVTINNNTSSWKIIKQ
jgi:hypothetical protein